MVEEGGVEERRGKKTEGRPPSGLIKSITSSLDVARDSPPCSSSSSFPFPFSLTPNSHNCSFFPLRRSSSYDGSHLSCPTSLRFLRGQVHRSRLFTLILILLPAVRLSYETASFSAFFPPPLPFRPSFSLSLSLLGIIPLPPRPAPFPLARSSLSFSTSSLNNCEPAACYFFFFLLRHTRQKAVKTTLCVATPDPFPVLLFLEGTPRALSFWPGTR